MRLTALERARFVWHDVRNFVARVWEGALEANVPFLASGLAFDALLAAVPFLLLLLSVVGTVLSAGAGRAQVELQDYLLRFLPGDARTANALAPVLRVIEAIVRERGTLRLLGIPLFIWFSTRLYASMRAALCEVFDVEETRSWVRGKLVDAALVLITTLLFLANTVLSEGVALLARTNAGFGFLGFFGGQLLAFVVVVTLFVLIFRIAPACPIPWDTALVAGAVCSIGFEAAKQVLSLYFATMVHMDRLVRDATVGAALVFVFWSYYMTFVFLIGAQIAQVYELRRRQAMQRLLLH